MSERTYTVQPSRIGRRHEMRSFTVVADLDAPTTAAVSIAEQVWKHARQFLVSSDFVVTVDVEARMFWIDGGRYGQGTFKTAD